MRYDDPVLTELAALYRFREDHARQFNFDLTDMADDLIREQEELEKQGRKFASYPPRRCRTEYPFTPLDEDGPVAPPVDMPNMPTDSTTATE